MIRAIKLDQTFNCSLKGEMDIFMITQSSTPYFKVNDIILDRKGKTSIQDIESFLPKIEMKYQNEIDKDAKIIANIRTFLYRFENNEDSDSEAYKFLTKLWRNMKIKKIL